MRSRTSASTLILRMTPSLPPLYCAGGGRERTADAGGDLFRSRRDRRHGGALLRAGPSRPRPVGAVLAAHGFGLGSVSAYLLAVNPVARGVFNPLREAQAI